MWFGLYVLVDALLSNFARSREISPKTVTRIDTPQNNHSPERFWPPKIFFYFPLRSCSHFLAHIEFCYHGLNFGLPFREDTSPMRCLLIWKHVTLIFRWFVFVLEHCMVFMLYVLSKYSSSGLKSSTRLVRQSVHLRIAQTPKLKSCGYALYIIWSLCEDSDERLRANFREL